MLIAIPVKTGRRVRACPLSQLCAAFHVQRKGFSVNNSMCMHAQMQTHSPCRTLTPKLVLEVKPMFILAMIYTSYLLSIQGGAVGKEGGTKIK